MSFNILAAGCGRKQVKYIKSRCIGIDLSLNYIKESKLIKPNNLYINGDVLNLPLKDEIFKEVIFTEVLEHVDNPKKALFEIRRVMKQKGILKMSVPIGEVDRFLGEKFSVYNRDVIMGYHKFLFSREQLEKLLKEFKRVKIKEGDKMSVCFWYLWSLVGGVLFNDLRIEESGRINSKNHPRLSKFVSKLLFCLAFFGKVFVKKKYYKTYYIEAMK